MAAHFVYMMRWRASIYWRSFQKARGQMTSDTTLDVPNTFYEIFFLGALLIHNGLSWAIL